MDNVARAAQQAEQLITEKLEQDFARAAQDPSLGAARGRFGRTTATALAALPRHLAYNKARGYNEADLGRLEAIRAFFADAGAPPLIEVWAGDASQKLGRHLADAGFYAAEVGATLVVDPTAPVGPLLPARDRDSGVEVREIGADDTVYLDVLFEGYGSLGPEARIARAMMTIEHRSARLRRYLAYVDGRPAAAAALYVHQGRCFMAGAATVPAMRGQGCQSALIRRRLKDAAAAGGRSVVVTTAYGSASQANLQRFGFVLVHTRTLWRRLDEQ